MAIMPTSKLRLLHNVPLHDYAHTVIYDNATAQYNDFMGYLKFNLGDEFTFIRDNGSIKVQLPIGSCYDVNYIMFQNTSYSNKWFYAFVTAQNYVNDDTTELEFTIDEMQSWMFEYTVEECFVEREHVMDDTPGNHTVPEGLETGPYVTVGMTSLIDNALDVYIAVSDLPDGYLELDPPVTWELPRVVNHMTTSYFMAKLGNARAEQTTINLRQTVTWLAKNHSMDAIVCVFTVPTTLVANTEYFTVNNLQFPTRAQSIAVKNNKLLTYPYCACIVETPGQAIELRYELFDENCQLDTVGIFGPGCKVSGYVVNYMGRQRDYERVLSLNGFPILPYANNMFENWWAMNKAQLVSGVIKDVASTAIGGIATNNILRAENKGMTLANKALTKNGGSDILRLERSRNRTSVRRNEAQINNLDLNIGGAIADNVLGSMGEIIQHQLVPNQLVGSADCADIFTVIGDNGFRAMCKGLRPEYVRIIDNYFEHYGYKVNAMKVPNIKGRPYWNYVKTIGANVHGTAPSSSIDVIRDVLNGGTTFWKSLANVENYSLNNH